jgi:serine carboxypeptidase-like clade 2
VNASHNRNLFYWLVESAGDPLSDPLVLWTNGGPGCSSLSGGLFSEFGPFRPNADGSLTLTPNPYTWTKHANIIFLEQPAGVGFSWSADTDDYTTGDFQSAQDAYQFLLGFTKRFPQYAGRELYISGESYGGHYVPSFAKAIVDGNAAGGNAQLNIRGFLVGNAWTVAALDNTGALDYWHSRTMIDDATRNGVLATCNMSDIGPLFAQSAAIRQKEADWEIKAGVVRGSKVRPLGFTPLRNEKTGKAAVSEGLDCDGWTNQAFSLLGSIDIYDSYVDVCTADSARRSAAAAAVVAASGPLGSGSNNNAGCALNLDPCIDDRTTTYLNNVLVKQAIHANASIEWTGCSGIVDYSRADLLSSMLPTYSALIAAGLRITVFSGDVDAIVPSLGSRAWITSFNRTTLATIRPWSIGDGQVGGWTTQYDGLNFTTVRNAGHFVPETQGERALYLFKNFVANTAL